MLIQLTQRELPVSFEFGLRAALTLSGISSSIRLLCVTEGTGALAMQILPGCRLRYPLWVAAELQSMRNLSERVSPRDPWIGAAHWFRSGQPRGEN